ncbi:hypothetical protein ACH5RR_037846 [Cinchona calisaya]|uniref:Uncharacterized protein n=1 Tax=Cinchona calisaya TaxID=153742 RepID=A0ABD2Y7E7_9GENT
MLQHKFHRILSLMRNYVTNNLEDSASHQELWQEFDRIQRYLDDGMNIAEQDARDLTMLMVIENWIFGECSTAEVLYTANYIKSVFGTMAPLNAMFLDTEYIWSSEN